ncbi:unnamed protein product, partial [Polarella glacialis]
FRLEGFDGQPPALRSMDPLLDLGVTGNQKMAKKALRVMLQRMTGSEMLLHFLDVHQEPLVSDQELQEKMTPMEVSEVVLHEVVCKMAQLAIACRRCPVPQKWIGSSVGLAFDAGRLPSRLEGESEVRKFTQVNIFDWGRSELNTFDKHMMLSDKEQHDRAEFWGYYVGGIDRLSWEAARTYRHRFGCTGSWSHLNFKICDFDSMTDNDFMGRLTVPIEETTETCADIMTQSGRLVGENAARGRATLTYSIRWRSYPQGSRFKGAWLIKVVSAQNLPRQDKMQFRTTSDPIIEIIAVSEDAAGLLCHRQLSSVKVKCLDPDWEETFELPVLAEPGALEAALESAAVDLGARCAGSIFPPEKMPDWQKEGLFPELSSTKAASKWSWSSAEASDVEKAFKTWESCLDAISASPSTARPQRVDAHQPLGKSLTKPEAHIRPGAREQQTGLHPKHEKPDSPEANAYTTWALFEGQAAKPAVQMSTLSPDGIFIFEEQEGEQNLCGCLQFPCMS